MKYLQYVPPEVVAKEAREAWESRNKTDEELWQDLIRSGLIRILEDGSVKVCYEREADPEHKETAAPSPEKPKSSRRRNKRR